MGDRIAFRGRVRHWREDPPGGLAVVDVPAEQVGELGGRRQYRASGSLNRTSFTGSTMLVAGGWPSGRSSSGGSVRWPNPRRKAS
jgi:hypothetical protein